MRERNADIVAAEAAVLETVRRFPGLRIAQVYTRTMYPENVPLTLWEAEDYLYSERKASHRSQAVRAAFMFLWDRNVVEVDPNGRVTLVE